MPIPDWIMRRLGFHRRHLFTPLAIPPPGDDPIPPGDLRSPYPVPVFTPAQKAEATAALRDRHVGVNAAPALGPGLLSEKRPPFSDKEPTDAA